MPKEHTDIVHKPPAFISHIMKAASVSASWCQGMDDKYVICVFVSPEPLQLREHAISIYLQSTGFSDLLY